jgi:hypothetical protein
MKMKRILFALLVATFVASCGDNAQRTEGTTTNDTAAPVAPPADTIATVADTPIDGEHAIYYVTIVDTGSNYHVLDAKMYAISKTSGLKIDTMGRYYNKEKNRILLRDDDEDEMYRGEYFPRRSPETNLSIEYLDFFRNEAGYGTMALIAGIYETEREADSHMVMKLKPSAPGAFVMRASVYIGCMH